MTDYFHFAYHIVFFLLKIWKLWFHFFLFVHHQIGHLISKKFKYHISTDSSQQNPLSWTDVKAQIFKIVTAQYTEFPYASVCLMFALLFIYWFFSFLKNIKFDLNLLNQFFLLLFWWPSNSQKKFIDCCCCFCYSRKKNFSAFRSKTSNKVYPF